MQNGPAPAVCKPATRRAKETLDVIAMRFIGVA
jgi:hypothetical protein